MNLDLPNSRIFTDFSANGRVLTVTTEGEINIFPLPIFFPDVTPQGFLDLPPLGESEEDLGPKILEFPILNPLRVIPKELNGFSVCGGYHSAVVVSVRTSLPPANMETPQIVPKVPVPLGVQKKNSNKQNKMPVSSPALTQTITPSTPAEKVIVTLQIAIFNIFSSYWVVVDGNFIANKVEIKNLSGKTDKNESKNGQNGQKGDKNDLDFVYDNSEGREFDFLSLKGWRLSSNVSTFCFHEDRSTVALGLYDGMLYISFSFFFFLYIFFSFRKFYRSILHLYYRIIKTSLSRYY